MGITVNSTDPRHAEIESSRTYYPLKLDVLGRRPAFRLSMGTVQIGPVTVGDLSFGTDVRLDCGDLSTAYHVNVPLTGALESEHRGETVIATPTRAAVYEPEGDTVLRRWPGECRQLCVKLERDAVESELGGMLGTRARATPHLARSLDVSSDLARSWVSLVRMLATEIARPGSVVESSQAGRHLGRALVSGFLLAVPHTYSEQLHDDGGPCRPRTVKRVMDAIDADPAADLAVADLARIAGVGVRALQAGFAQHLGLSPMSYVKSVRLARAHADLCVASPDEATVADIARRWGFGHLGRFAEHYRREYGCSPSQTLRRG